MNQQEQAVVPERPLEELLAEVRARLNEALSAREGINALLDAVISIGEDLDLDTVLRRLVDAARTLANCRYAALGVIGEDGTLSDFVPVGLDQEEIARIPQWPRGKGLLGLLIKEPRVLRVGDLSSHPGSYGFPTGHPPMRSFLGVPIRLRGQVFGNLYLTEKANGAQFDEQDESIITALATAAGVAIENARAYQETRAREVWLDASAEITRSLLRGAKPRDALAATARRAREMTSAEAAVVLMPVGPETVGVEATEGVAPGCEISIQRAHEAIASAFEGELRVLDNADIAGIGQALGGSGSGPVMLVPLGEPPEVRGLLALARRRGDLPFTTTMTRMLEAFGKQVAIAMELADARREAERYELLDERERIARDLHDLVIQRLYAAGLSLLGAIKLTDKPEVAQRVQTAVDGLDDTIRQIRATIFALEGTRVAGEIEFRRQITDLAEEAAVQLGYRPRVRIQGPVDTIVPDALVDDAIAVIRESLSNVVRHAYATSVEVSVVVDTGQLELAITDNGIGIGTDRAGNGLRNLAERATRRDGTFRVTPKDDGGGTVVRWRAPLP